MIKIINKENINEEKMDVVIDFSEYTKSADFYNELYSVIKQYIVVGNVETNRLEICMYYNVLTAFVIVKVLNEDLNNIEFEVVEIYLEVE